jgi:hypothetical protein
MAQNPETYMNLVDAIQAHIVALNGSDMYARDWVLVCGVDNIHPKNESTSELRFERSPGSAAYTVTGLLNWALDCYFSETIDE